MPSTWLTVTTPVPPIPTSRIRTSSAGTQGSGSGSGTSGGDTFGRAARFGGMTVMNDGQSPSRHEKSLLHDAWWMRVLRPNSVSTGSTERQPDFCAAVAAALADALVDDDLLRRVGRLAALARAAQLGGARLVVDQHGDAGDGGELALHGRGSSARSRTAMPAGSDTPE